MTKRKFEDRMKAHESDIQLNKSSAVMQKLNNKSFITIDFKKVKKLINYNTLNCTLVRETIEIIKAKSEIYNMCFMQQLTIDDTC